jgi:NADH-quinone oxidoreductase subunit L
VDVTLRADPLTAVMLTTVTFISLLVIVYSVGYMRGDPGYWRFFAYVSLFVFSMTMLVAASNFVLLYMFWEAVGLCSYLLIGFWFQRREASAAALKAFLVNRVGDFGFLLAILLLWTTYGTLDFHDPPTDPSVGSPSAFRLRPSAFRLPPSAPGSVPGILGQTRLAHPELYVPGGVAAAICLLLLLGACGKSAQLPLHVWLPDAMEGPTPVSALIHAATMVTAGVYLVARCSPLFAVSAEARYVVAAIGGSTALMAALVALTQTDLKRVLAYSTISQLGYMFLALGVGTLAGVAAGMFHLVTHAFFKALLFLGAGSVMHAMGGVVDVRQLGGLRRRLPLTHWTFLIGCLALAGVAPLAGFWSKDAILAAVAEKAGQPAPPGLYAALYWVGLLTAFVTAAYAFRAFFLTFYGPERIPAAAGDHAHESPLAMTGPMLLLALGALSVGAYFQATGDFLDRAGFLAQTPSLVCLEPAAADAEPHATLHRSVAVLSTLAAVAGIALAWLLYVDPRAWARRLVHAVGRTGLAALCRGKFFFDPIYLALVVRPMERLARAAAWIDRWLIDGAVNAVGALPGLVGSALRPLESGMLQFYALVMVLGLLALLGILLS